MRISKSIRHLGSMLITFVFILLTIFSLFFLLAWWSVVLSALLFPFFFLIAGSCVDSFDFWLRKKTKDPLWLLREKQQQGASRDFASSLKSLKIKDSE